MPHNTLSATRPSLIALTDDEIKVLIAAVYNGELSGKLKTMSGLTPAHTADIAADLFHRLKWHLDNPAFEEPDSFTGDTDDI